MLKLYHGTLEVARESSSAVLESKHCSSRYISMGRLRYSRAVADWLDPSVQLRCGSATHRIWTKLSCHLRPQAIVWTYMRAPQRSLHSLWIGIGYADGLSVRPRYRLVSVGFCPQKLVYCRRNFAFSAGTPPTKHGPGTIRQRRSAREPCSQPYLDEH
jgi:hypothetical protein